jgi:hypothetical protein
MVEIHEPSRLALVVEADRDRLARVLEGNPSIERLVRNRWIWLACLDPASGTLWELRPPAGGVPTAPMRFVPHIAEHAPARIAGESADWYQGKGGFLPPVVIVPLANPRVTQGPTA